MSSTNTFFDTWMELTFELSHCAWRAQVFTAFSTQETLYEIPRCLSPRTLTLLTVTKCNLLFYGPSVRWELSWLSSLFSPPPLLHSQWGTPALGACKASGSHPVSQHKVPQNHHCLGSPGRKPYPICITFTSREFLKGFQELWRQLDIKSHPIYP